MSDAVALGIAGIVVSGILGPGAAAWWTRKRQAADHEHEIRTEHREVIDDAARYLVRARRLNERVYEVWAEGTTVHDPPGQEAVQALGALVEEVRYGEERLALRLGQDHPVYKAYLSTTLVLTDQFNPIRDAYGRGESWAANRTKALDAIDAYVEQHRFFIAAAKDYLDS